MSEELGHEMRFIFHLMQDGEVRFYLKCEIDQGDRYLTQYEQVGNN